MPNRLLLVDGDTRSLRVLDVSLRGEGFAVDTATNGTDAWAMLDTVAPDLIITDTELEGMNGFEFCARLRRNPKTAAIPLIFLATDKALDQKIRGLEVGADDYLVKPAYVKEVAAHVRALLQRRDRDRWAVVEQPASAAADGSGASRPAPSLPSAAPGVRFAGDLAEIAVVDLIQLVEANGHSGIAHVRGPAGAAASIYFRRGRVVDAEVGRLSGAAALWRLFAWTAGTFDFQRKNIRRNDIVERSSADLVIEGMQRVDEWNRLSTQLGDASAIFEVDFRLLAERLAEIPDEVNGILRLFDSSRTAAQIVEDSAMADVEALTALLRLREEGIVYDRAGARPPRQSSGPELPPGDASSPLLDEASAISARSRTLTASGPVEQSFAQRIEAGARGDTAPFPFTPPGDNGLDEFSVRTPRRRTAPGLGQSTSPAASPPLPVSLPLDPGTEHGGHGIPQPRAEQHNVIRFPVPASAGPVAGSATAAILPAGPASARAAIDGVGGLTGPPATAAAALERTLLFGAVPDNTTAAVALTAGAGGATTAPIAFSATHRGFGAVPVIDDAPGWGEAGGKEDGEEEGGGKSTVGRPVPWDVRGPDGEPAPQFSGRVMASQPADNEPGDSGTNSADDGLAASPEPSAPPVDGRRRRSPSGQGVSGPRGDETMRVSFADTEISDKDAIDELGLPSRWRGAKFLAVAAVVGTLTAVAVHKFKRPAVPEAGDGLAVGAADEAASPPAKVSAAGEAAARVGAEADPPSATTSPGQLPAPPATAPPPVVLPGAAPGGQSAAAPPVTAAPPRPGGGESVASGTATGKAAATPVSSPSTAAVAPPPSAALVVPATAPAAPASQVPAVNQQAEGARWLAECRGAFSRNRMRDAFAACTASVEADPSSAAALTMLAHTELNRGHMSRAHALATRATKLDPSMADPYVIIGGVRQDSGQNGAAKEAYRRYLQLAPRGRYANELRAIVNSL